MDKYTVDLDQVLNDFEYSELTDQSAAPAPPYRRNYSHSSDGKKHSITNVFHSLNEYLNTDISPKVGDTSSSSSAKLEEIKEVPPEEVVPEGAVEPIIIESSEYLVTIETTVTNGVDPTSTANGGIHIIRNNLLDEVDEPKIEVDETSEEDEVSVTTEEVAVTTEAVAVTTEAVAVTTEAVAVVTPEEAKPIKVGFDEVPDVDESQLSQYLDQLELELGIEDPPVETNESQPPETETDMAKDDDLNDSHSLCSAETIEVVDDDPKESVSRPNNLAIVAVSESDTPVIDLVGNPGSTPYNNVYVTEALPKADEVKVVDTTTDDDDEDDESTSATFSDVSMETASSGTDTTNEMPGPPKVGEAEEATEKSEVKSAEVSENLQNEAVGGGEATDIASEAGPSQESSAEPPSSWLGHRAPLWVPDADALSCLHCDAKFTMIKRRHHCRACGLVLCSKCCGLRHHLEYLDEAARVCNRCYDILNEGRAPQEGEGEARCAPNPNNPLEYCSTVPPLQQVGLSQPPPPSVMVPVGVLKRKGSDKGAKKAKSVMFCDGIRPGSDLTSLDQDFGHKLKEEGSSSGSGGRVRESDGGSFVPGGEALPPVIDLTSKTYDLDYQVLNNQDLVDKLQGEVVTFAIQPNLYVYVTIINMDCCVNKKSWCFTTEGLMNVGQDEIVILLEREDSESKVPKDIFTHLDHIYKEAVKGSSIKELGVSLHPESNFLDSKNHAGFIYIRPTYQCFQKVIKPSESFLVGILIHRWETPWAKLFPLRLILRLGAEYRYYPSPVISTRHRDSVFVEIGHTIINLLADFRNFSYTLPQIRGLTIHMEDKNTTITIPSNCYDQIMKSVQNSSDHILAFAGNFSPEADSHLVCIQDTQSSGTNMGAYTTHAINIQNRPRKVTGASFIVFNGALKSSSGLTAKSSIVEDGLMIQVLPEHLGQIREVLRNMKDHTIQCGCVNSPSDETVNIKWGPNDSNFNLDVLSPIDGKSMAGVPSIRVHNGKDYAHGDKIIRWTEAFIIQNESDSGVAANKNQDPIDISKISQAVAKATCQALVKYLDLLYTNSFRKIAIRANLSQVFVSYSAGSNATKLPPIYMESLDNELVPVLHRSATNFCPPCSAMDEDGNDSNLIVLELIFRILNKYY